MSTPSNADTLDARVAQWRRFLERRRTFDAPDVEELEGHLRDQVAALMDAGLDPDEAFLVAVKRLGSLDALSREYAREHSDRLWKQLVLSSEMSVQTSAAQAREAVVVLALASAAALTIKAPGLFGLPFADAHAAFYVRHVSVFVLPWLAGYFIWKRGVGLPLAGRLALAFATATVAINLAPVSGASDTMMLSALHLPIALWLLVGIAYAGGRWFDGRGRMDFVRFSGELAIYYVLIALGGGVFTACTVMLFEAIGLSAEWLVGEWIIPCGALGAVLVAAWLVEAKQSVIENMAPVLTRLFTPLFTLLLLTFLATMAWTGRPVDVAREVLIGFDLLLALVVGLVLYAISARDPMAPPDVWDALQGLLIVSALAVDLVALAAVSARLSDFGVTPNRVAALGENLLLLVNLAWSAWLYAQVLRRAAPVAALERWQVRYLPAYAAWAFIVAAVFPWVFGGR